MADGHPNLAQMPSPTERPVRAARLERRDWQERAVVTVTSVAGSDTTSAANGSTTTANRIPIGPIVGGILAGVAVVCLIGGTWWYCAMKKEKERETRRQRENRPRAGTAASRPSIGTARPSATSLASTNKPSGAGRHDEKVPPVPAIPASAYTIPYGAPGQAHGQPQGYGGQQQQQHGQNGNNYQYQQPQYQAYQPQQAYEQPQQPMHQHGPPILAPPLDLSVPPPSSSSEGSSRSSTSDKPSRSAKSRARNLREPPPTSTDANQRYAPAKPSPLALAARVAREKSEADAAGPQWGQGPFRSMSADSQDGAGADAGRTEHLASPGRQPTSPGAYDGQTVLSPTQSGFSTSSGSGAREPSGEWGVAYTASGDNRYRQPVDSQTYQVEPVRPQPARTAVQYDTQHHRSPPRGMAGEGAGASTSGQAAYAYSQTMDSRAEDPYAQAALRTVSPVADPYLPASPSGRMYGRV